MPAGDRVSRSRKGRKWPRQRWSDRSRRLCQALEWLEPRLVLDSLGLGSYATVAPAWFAEVPLASAGPAAMLVGASPAATVAGDDAAASSRWIVRLNAGAAQQVRSPLGAEPLLDDGPIDFQVIRGLGLPGQLLVQARVPAAVAQTALAANPHLASFEIDAPQVLQMVPNDPAFGQQLGLQNTGQEGGTSGADIAATQAWDIARDSSRIVVGVVDSGVDYTHPDLYQNVWLNPGEIPPALRGVLVDTDADGAITFRDLNQPANAPYVSDRNGTGYVDAGDLLADPRWANGVDDDGSGFEDDLCGYDFADHTNDPRDDHGHGTHVTGTIAAQGDNGLGVTGVAWQAQVVPLKFLDARNEGTTSEAIAAVNYAVQLRQQYGVDLRVLNASWGSSTYSQQLRDSLAAANAAGMLVVAAAGNGDVLGRGVNSDLRPFYPAGYDLENIIAVAASDQHDQLASFSNFGPSTVDVAAPGVGILSTEPGGAYQERNGTSMAAPHVTGTVALVWAHTPEATAQEVRTAILSSVDALPSLQGKVATGGRLNAAQALRADPIPPQAAAANVPDLIAASTAPYRFSVTYTDNVAVDVATLDDFDVLVTKLGDYSLSAMAKRVSVDAPTNGTPRTVTYEIAAPGGSWDPADNGQYQLALRAGQVRDTAGNAAANRTLATFRVNVPAPQPEHVFLVTDTADSVDAQPGDGQAVDAQGRHTLRAAIMEANTHAGAESIQVAAGVFRLALAGADDEAAVGDWDVAGNLTIIGAGVDQTIVDAAALDRVFHILPGATLTLSQLTVRRGRADVGGAILNAGVLHVSDCTITESTATQSGGGLYNLGTLTMTATTVSENSASAGDGGGLVNALSGTATISTSTFAGNAAAGAGGGVFHAGALTLSTTTLSSNSATTGGALAANGAATIVNATIANNAALSLAGGVYSTTAAVTIQNTIIAANTGPAAADVSGQFTSAGHNLIGIGDGTAAFASSSNGDQAGTAAAPLDPRLAPLADYGGATATHALRPTSPAIDSGEPVPGSATDQRGAERQLDGPDSDTVATPDVGAFEFGAFFVTSTADEADQTPGDGVSVSSSGKSTLRAALQEANAITGSAVVYVPANVFQLTQGQLEITRDVTLAGAGADRTIIDADGRSRVLNITAGGAVSLAAMTVTGGQAAGDGGGILNGSATLSITDARITANIASGDGGGVKSSRPLSLLRTRVDANQAASGGGVAAADLQISHSVVTRNVATAIAQLDFGMLAGGGGIAFAGGGLEITGSEISFNSTAAQGGGINVLDPNSVAISDSAIVSNVAGDVGGGISVIGVQAVPVALTNVTIGKNQATQGAGMLLRTLANVAIRSSTIVENEAVPAGSGRVVHYPPSCGGIKDDGGDVLTVANTIIAQNSGASPDIAGGSFVSAGHNLIGVGDGSSQFTDGVGGDLVGTAAHPRDPYLGPWQDNGGPTRTYALRAGSPAIDAGSNATVVATDARGIARPQDGDGNGSALADMGAYEFVYGAPTAVGGQLFNDQNANGLQEAGEGGLAGQTVFVDLNYDGVPESGEPQVTTDDRGQYVVNGLTPGDYVLGGVQQANWEPTSPRQLDFQEATTLAATDRTQDVASGDVDGDGNPDLVAANFGGDNVSVFLGKGAVQFADAVNYPVGTGPVAVTLADLDGDGRLDIVTADATANQIAILKNLGRGTFSAATFVATGTGPQDVVACDLDRDGHTDLVIANSGSHDLSVLRNHGDGTFAALENIPVPSSNATAPSPAAVAVADLDGDGDCDLAVVNLTSFDVAVLANDGLGNFLPLINLPVGSFPRAIAAGDVNGDRREDLIVANSLDDNVSVLLNQGDGNFAERVNYAAGDGPRSVALVDLDDDGFRDIVSANANSGDVSAWLNQGDGTFLAASNYAAGRPTAGGVLVDDFDRDGQRDLVTANFAADDVTLLRNIQGFQRVTLLPSDRFMNLDFGNRLLRAELHGTVYRDFNRNGLRDEGEPGLAGWTLYLDQNHDGVLDTGESTTTSGATGAYVFTNLAPLTAYTVRGGVCKPAGSRRSHPPNTALCRASVPKSRPWISVRRRCPANFAAASLTTETAMACRTPTSRACPIGGSTWI